jgi:hypothetical protein
MEVKNNRTIELNEVQNTLKKPKKVQKAVPTIPSDEDIIKILVTQAKLIKRKSQKIQDINPIMLQNGKPVFFPNTINVIQGQAGVHKSRLGATVCSALLKKSNCQNSLLGFKSQTENENFSVLYVDTERNLSDQYPLALQSIQINAGYGIKTTPPEFDFISLLEFPRKDRFSILNKYLNYYRSIYKDRPTFIVLDVSTDCIEDFNKSDKSMELIDHMNLAINTHNVVFLCLIHENPGSEKARGHFGTELINKASTVMRVDFEKDNNGPRDVIQVRYLKCRSTAKHEPFYIRYSYSYPQKSDSKLNKFFYTKFAVYDKEKINISI